MDLMVLLGDVGPMESQFGAFEDSVINSPMVILGDEAQVEAHFSPCGDSANLDAR